VHDLKFMKDLGQIHLHGLNKFSNLNKTWN